MSKVLIFGSGPDLDQIKRPPEKKLKTKRILFALNEQQRKDILEEASKSNSKHYLIIRTQLESGLRIAELANLIIEDLDVVNNSILVRSKPGGKYNLAFSTKTISSNRAIPIPKELVRELRAFIGSRKTGYIFETQKKTQENKGRYGSKSLIDLINLFAKKTNSIGKNIGSHCLRRTYASYLLQKRIDIGMISRLLGHSNVATTLKYLYGIYNPEALDDVRKVLKKMNK